MTSQTPSISFEFFPPKTEEGKEALLITAKKLAAVQPNYFSVTFGAGGSTRDGTLDTVKMLQKKTNIVVAPHLSCIGSTREQIIEMLEKYKEIGVRRIVALRGDLPSGMGQAGEFRFASELVQVIREETGQYFHIEVAAYPEVHPEARNQVDDILNLKRKCDAGANSAITQFFFNPDAYFYYLEECVRYAITIPIIPGIMPILKFSKLARFADSCGAEIPRWMRKRLEYYGDDIVSMHQFSHEVTYHLCERLLAGGAPGLHLYTLNQVDQSISLLKDLGVKAAKQLA